MIKSQAWRRSNSTQVGLWHLADSLSGLAARLLSGQKQTFSLQRYGCGSDFQVAWQRWSAVACYSS